jgi:hypothetical protein
MESFVRMSRVFGSLNAGDLRADDIVCRNLLVTQRATFEEEIDISSAVLVGETIVDATLAGITTLSGGQIFSGALRGDATLNIQGIATLQDDVNIGGGLITNQLGAIHASGWSTSIQVGGTPSAWLITGADPSENYKPAIGLYSNAFNDNRSIYFWGGDKCQNAYQPNWPDYTMILGSTIGIEMNTDVTIYNDLEVYGTSHLQNDVNISGNVLSSGGIVSGTAFPNDSGWNTSIALGGIDVSGAFLLQGSEPNEEFRPAMGIYSDEANGNRSIFFWAGERSGNAYSSNWQQATMTLGGGIGLNEDVTISGNLEVNGVTTFTDGGSVVFEDLSRSELLAYSDILLSPSDPNNETRILQFADVSSLRDTGVVNIAFNAPLGPSVRNVEIHINRGLTRPFQRDIILQSYFLFPGQEIAFRVKTFTDSSLTISSNNILEDNTTLTDVFEFEIDTPTNVFYKVFRLVFVPKPAGSGTPTGLVSIQTDL